MHLRVAAHRPLADRPRRAVGRIGLAAATAVMIGAACSSDGKELDPPADPLPPGEILDGAGAASVGGASTVEEGSPESLPAEPLQLLGAWPDGAALPTRHTCADSGVAPALAWTLAPPGTAEIAVSAINVTDGRRVLWLLEAIDPVVGSIEEGGVPAGAVLRINDAGTTGWDPPCPAAGEQHEIVVTIYALAQQVELPPNVAAAEVVAAYEAAALDTATITATVQL